MIRSLWRDKIPLRFYPGVITYFDHHCFGFLLDCVFLLNVVFVCFCHVQCAWRPTFPQVGRGMGRSASSAQRISSMLRATAHVRLLTSMTSMGMLDGLHMWTGQKQEKYGIEVWNKGNPLKGFLLEGLSEPCPYHCTYRFCWVKPWVGESPWCDDHPRVIRQHGLPPPSFDIFGLCLFHDPGVERISITFRIPWLRMIVLFGEESRSIMQYLERWTSLYQLFWSSPGYQGFDPHLGHFIVQIGILWKPQYL